MLSTMALALHLGQLNVVYLKGSILGPLFFLIYINDLCNASNVIDLVLFADDTNLFFFVILLTKSHFFAGGTYLFRIKE